MQIAPLIKRCSLVEKLLHSYKYHGWILSLVETPVVKLVRLLENEAQMHGYTLSRWHTNDTMRGYPKAITYGIHKGPRPRRSASCSLTVTLDNLEGKTERCEAFVKLTRFLYVLSQMDGMSGRTHRSDRIAWMHDTFGISGMARCGTCICFAHLACQVYIASSNGNWDPRWLACGQYRINRGGEDAPSK